MRELCRTRLSGLPLPAGRNLALRAARQARLNSYRLNPRCHIEYLIGLLLSAAVAGFAATTGFERDRAFYPTVLIIVAHYYVLFAAIATPGRTIATEILVAGAFLFLAVLGFKRSLWLVAAAIAGHGVFDFFHHSLIENPGVPRWWPGFCLAFDLGFGASVAMRQYLALKFQSVSRTPRAN